MSTYTVFCTDEDTTSHSTIWIASVEAVDTNAAAIAGRRGCANDWNTSQTAVKVLGVAEGSVNILDWCDDGIELPAPEELVGFKVEINAFPGCDFTGAMVFELGIDDAEGKSGQVDELEEYLGEIDIGDDSRGGFYSQVVNAAGDMAISDQNGEIAKAKSLVLAAGVRGSTGVVEESFDVTIDVVPVYETAEEED